jgi:acetylornithine deacetylase/succinyl-diaminopimelate desuccinylase-like protein
VLELAVEIQQISAPTFEEAKRAEFIHQLLVKEQLHEVCMDEAGNVLACFPGVGKENPLIISAHMDTVFPLQTDLRIKRSPELIHGPGIGDNSLGVAALFGLILWNAPPLAGCLVCGECL